MMSVTSKIINQENFNFVLNRLSDGEVKKTEITKEFLVFCKGAIKQNFGQLICAMTWKFPIYESDDGKILGLLKTTNLKEKGEEK